jgi:hypothetical protein
LRKVGTVGLFFRGLIIDQMVNRMNIKSDMNLLLAGFLSGMAGFIYLCQVSLRPVRQQTVEDDGMAATKLRVKGGF